MTGSPYVSPVSPAAAFGRVDQGVDYTQSTPYLALGAGTITAVTGGFAGGTGQAVYETLDQPVTLKGITYSGVYYAETSPLVSQGAHVAAGQPVSSSGSAEIGFASGNAPAAPLIGGLGAGTQPTLQGQDFYDLVSSLLSGTPPNTTTFRNPSGGTTTVTGPGASTPGTNPNTGPGTQPPSNCNRNGESFAGCFCGITDGVGFNWNPLDAFGVFSAAKPAINFFTEATPCLAEWAYQWLQRIGLLLAAAGLALLGLYLVARDAGAAPSLAPSLSGA